MLDSDRAIIDRSKARAVAVARRVFAADLADRPLYIIQPTNELGEDGSMITRAMIGHNGGLFFRGLARAVQPQLEAAGQWRGDGVGIVLDVLRCFVLAADNDDAERAVVGATLHELCHWLDFPELSDVEAAGDRYAALTAASQCFAEGYVSPALAELPPTFTPLFMGHSQSFTRLAVHARWRAAHGAGMILRPSYLRFGADYFGLEILEPPGAYIEALGDEPELLEGLPLRRIAALPLPPTFELIWDETYSKMYAALEAA